WPPSITLYRVTKLILPLAFILLVSGLMTKNPTSVGQDSAVDEAPSWIIRITRHPVQWGILLWAIGHLIANGDKASIVFFGSFALVSCFGMISMDARRRKLQDPAWNRFLATTSVFPFVALATGKTSLPMRDIAWLPILIALVVFALVYLFHNWIGGVPIY
ncbi:MAG: hypothetical protein KDI19_12920, partial [Pseudomonadales bacterium]|nr:hypothetical protein [Pseudomonadales bacterium]